MDPQALLRAFRDTRSSSLDLCRPLAPEVYRIQSMPDVSPPWWNLGHTTWFFAKNILEPFGAYGPEDRRLEFVLNSYYEALGPRLERHRRGLATKPTTEEIVAFRERVDERLERLIESSSDLPPERRERLTFLVTTGIQHEQQHQELLVTEVKHILGFNPPELREPYGAAPRPDQVDPGPEASPLEFLGVPGGVVEIGNREGGWCFDNELGVHKVYLEDFRIADRLVTNGEFLEFVADGGYRQPLLWLANGWDAVGRGGWQAPLYWHRPGGEAPDPAQGWHHWTFAGDLPLDPHEPVAHLSFYEAEAYARWRSQQSDAEATLRLPTEFEWEHAARTLGYDLPGGNLLDDRLFRPRRAPAQSGGLPQAAGDLWEWTTSHYEPYPGFAPFGGDLGEYNEKFMDNQRVLRGGSYATPRNHLRPSYRNFWPADTRFQMTGLRPVQDR